jgi:hypothetical protein
MGRSAGSWAARSAALLALVMAGVYVAIMREQGDPPVVWFLGALLLGALGAGYGSVPAARHRTGALVLAGLVLALAGLLALLTIGFPVLVAAALCVAAAAASASGTVRLQA